MTDTSDDSWFDHILGQVDATTPDDLRAEIHDLVAVDDRTFAPVGPETQRSKRLLVSVAATIVVIVVGLVIVIDRGGSHTIAPSPASRPAVQPPAPTTTPDTAIGQHQIPPVATPTTEVTPDASGGDDPNILDELGLTPTTTLSGDDAADALATLSEYRVQILRESAGFSATATSERTWVLPDGSTAQPVDPPTVVDVTVLADGDAWAQFANGDLFRLDAGAGIARGLYSKADDGSLVAWETNTVPGQHGYGQVLEHDPLALIGGNPERPRGIAVEVSATMFERRDAVEVRLRSSNDSEDSRYVIDLASALVVDYERTQVDDKGTSGLHSMLSDLRDADSAPVPFLPELPDGLEWLRFHDPSIPVAATIDEASDAFGPGLVLPRAAIESDRVTMEHRALSSDWGVVDLDDPDAVSRYVLIEYIEPVGLLRTIVHLSTERRVPGEAIPDGYEQIGDRICLETCDSEAPAPTTDMTPQTGALAGVPFSASSAYFDGISVSIEAPTDAATLAIANSFVAVTGD